MTDIFGYCACELPQWNPISVSGYHIREAGSTAIQEVAFTLANGLAYIEAGRARGLSAESLAERMSFFFAAHNDFLEEIAKFRAARRLWARWCSSGTASPTPRAQQLRFHAQTAGSTLTAQQPDNNLVRVTVQALAAVLGGAQSLHCNGRDEALALPTEESATLALRTQQIIAFESGVANTVDPVAGSYEIEARTNDIEAGARALLKRIEGAGGTLAAIESGMIQREIQESAFRAQQAVESGRRPGCRRHARFQTDEAAPIPTLSLDPAIEARQKQRVQAFGPPATTPHGGRRWNRSGKPQWAPRTSCRPSLPPSRRKRRSAKSQIRYAMCLANIAKRRPYDASAPRCRADDHLQAPTGVVRAVDNVSLELRRGETLGLVGESGSGKSMTALSILRLVQPPGVTVGGPIAFNGRRDLLELSEREMRKIRGAEIALIFQEPMTALEPGVHHRRSDRRGDSRASPGVARGGARSRRRAARGRQNSRSRQKRVRDYPHQLSGGMRQRVLIAMALACQPLLLIADEPTTALDVTIQAEILDLLREMKEKFDLALLLITHDLGVVAGHADRIAVMYAGRIVEEGPVRQVFQEPAHPYTRGLLASIPGGAPGQRLAGIEGTVPNLASLPPGCAFEPRCPERFAKCVTVPPLAFPVAPERSTRCYLYDRRSPIVGRLVMALVEVRHLSKQFTRREGIFSKPSVVRAVNDVSFTVDEGETFGLVGESGSGKTTTGRCILRLIEPTSGEVLFRGENVLAFSRDRLRRARRQMQIVFQDPYSSLNPRMRVRGGLSRNRSSFIGSGPMGNERRVSSSCSTSWASIPRISIDTRMNSAAASGSGSAWRGRWR